LIVPLITIVVKALRQHSAANPASTEPAAANDQI
jgi:hypothetical protein